MKTFQYKITDEVGIHARPAGELAKLSKEFRSKITLSQGEKTVDAGRLMAVMAMGIKKGQEVTVTVEGSDEEAAAEKIKEFFQSNL